MSQITYPPLVVISVPELGQLIANQVSLATVPLIEQLEAVERRLAQPRLRYSTHEIADMYGVKVRSIRQWMHQGRVDRNGRTHFLKASELTKGKYSISLENVDRFLSFFE